MNSASPMALFDWSEKPLKGGWGGFGAVYKVDTEFQPRLIIE
jgi:hypothetical protein